MLRVTVGLCPGGRELVAKSLRRQTSVECDVYLRPQLISDGKLLASANADGTYTAARTDADRVTPLRCTIAYCQ
jgi:hypothetical protein